MTNFLTNASERRNERLIPLLSLLSGGTLLGLSTNLAKLASEAYLTPLAFLGWSIIGAALILITVAAGRRELPPVNARTLEYYAVSALTGVAGPNLLFFSAVPHVGAGFVALLISLPPLLTYVGALAFKMERFQGVRAVGVTAALTGAGILAAGKLSAPNANGFWIIIVLIGTVLLAIGNLYRSIRWPTGVSASALAPGTLITAAIMLLGAGFLPGFSLAVALDRSLPIILIATQSAIFAGIFWLLFLLQKTGGPVLLSLLGSVGALVGVPVAIFLLGEAPPKGLFPGAVLITIGVALLTFGGAKRA